MNDFRLELIRTSSGSANERLAITPELNISIQASEYHCCTPRTNMPRNTGYTAFELGFPNFDPPEYIAEYAEDFTDLQETIYSNVPYQLIQKMINEMRGAA